MLLLEADGKFLLRKAGIATPRGVRLRDARAAVALPGTGPWIAKAQVPVGGRGKAGGILSVASLSQLQSALDTLLGMRIKGYETREVLVEERSVGHEHYLALMVDAGAGGVRLIYSPHGGMDVESHAHTESDGFNEVLPLNAAALEAAARRLSAGAEPSLHGGLFDVCRRLIALFLERQLMLAEINPLFAQSGGNFVAGDAKLVIDTNTLPAQPLLRDILTEGRALYPDAWRKLSQDFDFVEVDPAGQVGLVTTGAGLSMMLIDEMVDRGLVPYNFCDMRTGQMRGSPARLLQIFDWLAAARDVRVVLVNIFAGITDLSEFARLLVDALHQRPNLRLPIVARLVGHGEVAAQRIIAANPSLGIDFEPDLEKAITLTARRLREVPRREASHAV